MTVLRSHPRFSQSEKNRAAPGLEAATSGKVTDAAVVREQPGPHRRGRPRRLWRQNAFRRHRRAQQGRLPDAWQGGEKEETLLKTDPRRYHERPREHTVLENPGTEGWIVSTHISKLRYLSVTRYVAETQQTQGIHTCHLRLHQE